LKIFPARKLFVKLLLPPRRALSLHSTGELPKSALRSLMLAVMRSMPPSQPRLQLALLSPG
jgi:hypothetical protein